MTPARIALAALGAIAMAGAVAAGSATFSPSSAVLAATPPPDPSCQRESSVKSTAGTTRFDLTFINNTNETLQTLWLDYAGRRVFYNQIPAGTRYVQPTWITHPWIVADLRGTCLVLYVADGTQSSVSVPVGSVATPSPSPSPSPSPVPTPSPSPSQTPSPAPVPTPSPSPVPAPSPTATHTVGQTFPSPSAGPATAGQLVTAPTIVRQIATGEECRRSFTPDIHGPCVKWSIDTEYRPGELPFRTGTIEIYDPNKPDCRPPYPGSWVCSGRWYTIQLNGDLFAPGSYIQVVFSSSPVIIGGATADSAGGVSTRVRIPQGAEAGNHTIEMRGVSPDGLPLSISIPVTVGAATSKDEARWSPLAIASLLGLATVILGALGAFIWTRRRRVKRAM